MTVKYTLCVLFFTISYNSIDTIFKALKLRFIQLLLFKKCKEILEKVGKMFDTNVLYHTKIFLGPDLYIIGKLIN